MTNRLIKIARKLLKKKKIRATLEDPVDEALVVEEIAAYEKLLRLHSSYYISLTTTEKDRFLKRLYRFHRSKRFHYIGMEPLTEPAVLISAVAVQISFGLKRFMLPYFRDIYIMPDVYHLRGAGELYIGHVSPKGIYISWHHFQEGFAIPNDGVNVAFHELAHAVHHENFIEETGIDWEFREDFAKLSSMFGPSLSRAITERKSYLRGYAFSNFHEFWAVSVEAFFELPAGLKQNMPELYNLLCAILNQDPLQSPKVLTASE